MKILVVDNTMQRISSINRASRKNIQSTLTTALDAWLEKWLKKDYELTVNFTEKLFDKTPLSYSDQAFDYLEGKFVVYNCNNTFLSMAKLSLEYENDIDDLDNDIFTLFCERVIGSLFQEVSGSEKFNKIELNEINQAVHIECIVGNVKIEIGLDKKIVAALGLLVNSEGKCSKVKANFEEAIASLELNVKSKLGAPKLSFQDLVSLKSGDVFPLNHRLDAPIILEVEGRKLDINSFLIKSGNNKGLYFSK